MEILVKPMSINNNVDSIYGYEAYSGSGAGTGGSGGSGAPGNEGGGGGSSYTRPRNCNAQWM